MRQADLRGISPLKPAHLIGANRGLIIGCEEMKHLRDNQYQCIDDGCRIVYKHLRFSGYSLLFGKEPLKCKPHCVLLKRNADYNFVCMKCGGYWYFQPGQKFMLSLDDLYIQDSRVVKFLIGKLEECIKTAREVDAAVLREKWRLAEDSSARMRIAIIEKLELCLSQLSKIYRI